MMMVKEPTNQHGSITEQINHGDYLEYRQPHFTVF